MAFVGARDAQFFLDGAPFHVHGFNAYFLMVISAQLHGRSKAVEVLSQASSVGLNVCRTWAFGDGCYQALQISPGVYDDKVFQVCAYICGSFFLLLVILI
jgi:mannan endo-1,4-beta-mannosidase